MIFELNKNMFFIKGKGYVLTVHKLILEKEYFVDYHHKNLSQWEMGSGIHKDKSTWCDVVIATDASFKLESIPQFEVPIDSENDLNTIAFNHIKDIDNLTNHPFESRRKAEMFKLGYQTRENKGTYTEEDMQTAFIRGHSLGINQLSDELLDAEYIILKDEIKPSRKLTSLEVIHTIVPCSHCNSDCYNFQIRDCKDIDNQKPHITFPEKYCDDGILVIKNYKYE